MLRKKIYLIGAGPGKADLITVRGKRILEEAEVVLYDYLVDRSLLSFVPAHAEMICCGKLAHKGRYSYGHPVEQQVIEKLMLEKVNEGKKVVRLKNGDPAFFSRFSEELSFLTREGLEFEVVPGVTAAGAASSLCGLPLTDRDLSPDCRLAPGHQKPGADLSATGKDVTPEPGTLVIYMGVGSLKRTVERLLNAGNPSNTPVVIIQDVSLLTQKQVSGTLADIADVAEKAGIAPPAIIIIGMVAGRSEEFNWTLRNKRILFTGLSRERFFLEGNYIHVPLIRILPADDNAELDKSITGIHKFSWVVFTSRYGVQYFFERLRINTKDARALARTQIAVIGRSTAQMLDRYGLKADLIPADESSKGLAEAFGKIDIKGTSMLMPRSDISDKGLTGILTGMGAEVITPVAYKNVMPEDLPDLDLDSFDEIMFTSPSTVRNFKQRYGKVPDKVVIKCIGDVTSKEAERCRLRT